MANGGVGVYGAGVWLPSLFGIGTPPAQYYVGLTTAAPRANMTGVEIAGIEPDGAAYARQLIPAGASWWSADGNTVTNTAALTFPTPAADWGRITHFVLCTTVAFGDLICWGVLRNPQNVVQSNAPRLPAGSLIISMPTG